MSQKSYDLTRRKALLGLGGVGIGSTLGGAGTMAWLNDQENSTGNTFTAGELDLKLDWKLVYNGKQTYTDQQQQTNNPGPIFETPPHGDVKPGDHGSAAISVHIDGNPAWLWLGGEITGNHDNGLTEPEKAAGDTTGGAGEGDLVDEMAARVWYDENGNNQLDKRKKGQDLEVALVSDVSGSMGGDPDGDGKTKLEELKTAAGNFVANFSKPDEGAAVSFKSNANVDQDLTTNYTSIEQAINNYSPGGGTDIAAGIDKGRQELLNGQNATQGADKVMVLLSDGQSNASAAKQAAKTAKQNGIRIITIAFDATGNFGLMQDLASSNSDAYKADSTNLNAVYQKIAKKVFLGEEVLVSGTFRQVMNKLSGGIALDGDRSTKQVDPYPGNQTQYIGFEWWIPESVGNVIQGDSTTFDLEFYAEQARHNDNPSNPFAP